MNGDRKKVEYTSPYGSKKWEYFSIFACSMLLFCVGIEIGWNSPIVVLLLSPNSPIHDSKLDISIFMSACSIGQVLASLINMQIIDRIGRKYTILLYGLPLVASWSIILITRSILMWSVARFLSGICFGMGFQVVPLYLGEISSIKSRGANGSMVSIMYDIGILVSYILVPRQSINTTTGIFLFFLIFVVVLLPFIPESPYYLALKERTEEAEKMLQKLRGKTDVSNELTSLHQYLEKEDKSNVKLWTTLKNIFTIKRNRRAFFIIFLLYLNIYFNSYIPLIVYGQLIFKEIANNISDYTINIAMGVTLLLSSILNIFFVDRFGRKVLILVSGIIIGLCNFAISSYFYTKNFYNIEVSSYYLIPIIASFSAIFFLNLGFCSISPIMISEIFAIEVKVLNTSILMITGAILMGINSELYTFLAISLNYGHGLPFLGFAFLILLSTAVVYYLSPETKGKTFIEIQRELQN